MPLKINLLPKDDLEKKPLGKFFKWMLSYGRYIIISVELVVLTVFFSRFIYDRQLTDLSEAIEQKQAIVASAVSLEQQVRETQSRLQKIQRLESGRLDSVNSLTYLEQLLPADVFLSKIAVNGKELTFSGKAASNSGFAQLLASLKTSKIFTQIELTEVQKDEVDGSIDFKIKTTISFAEKKK